MRAKPNSNIQIITTVSDRHLIPLTNVDGSLHSRPQYVVAESAVAAETPGYGVISYGLSPVQIIFGAGNLGAINLAALSTVITTTAVGNMTMAVGTIVGQVKKIRSIAIVTACSIAVSGSGFQSIVSISFDGAAQYIALIWNGSGWIQLESYNLADGVSPGPFIAVN